MTEKDIKQTFQELEDNLNYAYETKDLSRLSELLADTWTILEPSIGIVSKIDFMSAIKAGKLIQTSMQKEVIEVKIFDDTAVVITRGRNIGQYLGKPYDTDLWVINIYIRANARWTCISTQEAPVSCQY